MKLRTQLIVAFLLLAVVPLGAITLYSYSSSARALRRTVEAEAARMAEEMNHRLTVITSNLNERIDRLEDLPFPEERAGGAAPRAPDPLLVGGAGLLLAALALFGIVPISSRMTHNVSDLTRAAGELAAGRLDTQVKVRSRDELGQLAEAFNRMAREAAADPRALLAKVERAYLDHRGGAEAADDATILVLGVGDTEQLMAKGGR